MALSKTGLVDVTGNELILDADADTSITADTDDQIDIRIAGADDFAFKTNKFEVQSGSNIDMNGNELILDADADTSIIADTDDLIDFKVAGSDRVYIDSSGQIGLYAADDLADATKKATIYNTGSAFEVYASSNSSVNKGINFHTSTTSGSAGLKIDASGHVLKPKQPAFLAYGTGVNGNITEATVGYSEQFDTNSDYTIDYPHMYFTAPVAGVYQFNGWAWCATNTNEKQMRVFKKPVAYATTTWASWVANQNPEHTHYSKAGTLSHSWVLKLAAGDEVEIRIWSATADQFYDSGGNSNYHGFSGFLVG